MTRTTHLSKRITVAIALAASLAPWAVQPALAFDGRSPDTREAARGGFVDARSPDTREAAQDLGRQGALIDARSPDTLEAARDRGDHGPLVDARSPDTREAVRHLVGHGGLIDARSPDTREAAQPRPVDGLLVQTVLDARSPDARDAAEPPTLAFGTDAERPIVSSDAFHWGDFGIGVGTAFAAMLLVAGLVAAGLAARQRHARAGSATT